MLSLSQSTDALIGKKDDSKPYTVGGLVVYAHYEPSEELFVNREKQLDWMDNALTQCHDQSVILHLHGIGGIGKTALLEHWKHTIEASLLLDCNRITHLFDRLESIARNAAQLGIQLRRFDLLWSIRLRFIKGIEPAKEPGRTWAYDVIKPLPFIGSLVNISKAIHTIGGKLKDRLKHKFGDVSDWLNNRLGSEYSEKLLEILWKDPHHAEFLFLDALLEDLNSRKNKEQSLLLLFDHMEDVDAERLQWRYRGRKISETELWFIFLSSLHNTVGVTASRRRLPKAIKESITVEELEITELDTQSCHQLLTERGITENEIQTQITSVSGGNPFVLHTICDMNELGKLSLEDIENLRADTLEQVRIKTWRRLFNQAKDLSDIIDRAGLLPFFNRKIMDIITPSMKSADWDQILQLSFIQDRGDGNWTLHALARELVLAELDNTLPSHVSEVANLLEQSAADNADPTYRGLAISAKILVDEAGAIIEWCNFVQKLWMAYRFQDALSVIDIIPYKKEESRAIMKWLRGRLTGNLYRVAEAEQDFLEAHLLFRQFAAKEPEKFLPYLIWTNLWLLSIFTLTGQFAQFEDIIQQNYQLIKRLSKMQPEPILGFQNLNKVFLSWHYFYYARFLMVMERYNEAEAALKKSYEITQDGLDTNPSYLSDVTGALQNLIFLYLESGRISEAENAYQEMERVVFNYFEGKPLEETEVIPFLFGPSKHSIQFSTGEFKEAIGEINKVIESGQKYIEDDKTDQRTSLFVLLYFGFLGIALKHTNRLTEANDAFKEALKFARIGCEKEPRTFIQLYGFVHNNMAILQCQLNHTSEASSGFNESLRVFRQLADQTPELYLPYLAQAINNYAIHLRQTGNLKQAESTIREALSIRRKRAESNPDYFLYQVASSLNNLGVILAEGKKLHKARDALFEAYQLRKKLFEKAPKLYSRDFASTLTNLGLIMKRLDRLQEAEQYYQEAIGIWDPLAAEAPDTYQGYLTQSLVNLAFLHSANQDSSDDFNSIMKRLRKLGVSALPESEVWIELMEEYFRVPS